MPNDLPQGDLTAGESVHATAAKLLERRMSGTAPEPDGPPPEDYEPEQNAATEDESIDESPVTEELETEEDQEIESEDEQIDADDESPAPRFAYIDEIAEAAGVPLDELLSEVKIRTIVDGEHGEVSLAELRKGHQLESSFTRKNQQFLEQKKAFEAQQEQKRNELNDQFAKAGKVFEAAQQQLYSDFSGIDWNKLQAEDPQQWTAKRQQFGERQARLNHVIQTTTQQLEQARDAQKAQAEENRQRQLEAEHNLLMEKVPEWKDENKAQTEGTQIAQYLQGLGFSQDELNELSDHRLIVLARAALGLAGPSKKKLALAKKKVEKLAPRVSPGSGKSSRGSGATRAAQEATQKAKSSGNPRDVAQALLARRQARTESAKRGRRARI